MFTTIRLNLDIHVSIIHPLLSSCALPLIMEAVCTSETSVSSNETTWCYIPEGSHLHTHHHENLVSHINHLL
jgi:hypothetical protein